MTSERSAAWQEAATSSVLIFSNLLDPHAQAVMARLAARGIAPVLLDSSEYPTRLSLSMSFSDGRRQFSIKRQGAGSLDLDSIRSVWWRRPQPFGVPSDLRHDHSRNLALSEATTAFQGLYNSMSAFWINRPSSDAAAAHKPWQLTVAQEVGLDIPPTLMTSDPEAARTFWRIHGREVVYKQFLALPYLWRETRRLRPEDDALAESIAYAPVIFQRYIEAVADIRVIAVGPKLFASATTTSEATYPVDVRMNIHATYSPHRLPKLVADRLLELMRRLDLVYGAIDLRLTPDGNYIFLEINPAGQFLYLDSDTTSNVVETLADYLIAGHCDLQDRDDEKTATCSSYRSHQELLTSTA